MENHRKIIRFTLWWGIIADLFETIRMIFPNLFITTAGLQASVNREIRFALLYGAPVMFGWVLILFWAERKPVERKCVFLCLIPVILAYAAVEIYGIISGLLVIQQTIPALILQGILLTLTTLSYFLARNIEKSDNT